MGDDFEGVSTLDASSSYASSSSSSRDSMLLRFLLSLVFRFVSDCVGVLLLPLLLSPPPLGTIGEQLDDNESLSESEEEERTSGRIEEATDFKDGISFFFVGFFWGEGRKDQSVI